MLNKLYPLLIAVLVLSVNAHGALFYEIVMDENKIQDVYLINEQFSMPSGDYHFKLYGFNGSVIEDYYLQRVNGTFHVPFANEGKSIEISYGGESTYYEVGFFTSKCGDGKCQVHESMFSCPEDCPTGVKDEYCDKKKDGKCDPDCPVMLDEDCAKNYESGCNYNKICEDSESKESCPEDCLSSEYCMVLKDGKCDPDCPGMDLDCYCGDGNCQSYENTYNCKEDCESLNSSMLTYTEKTPMVNYEIIIPFFILFCAILLFFYNEVQLKKMRRLEK